MRPDSNDPGRPDDDITATNVTAAHIPAEPTPPSTDETATFFGAETIELEEASEDDARDTRVVVAGTRRSGVGTGLAFLLPNILGFLAFTAIPLVASLYFAFTNWDLRQHNPYKETQVGEWVGFDNFKLLFTEPDFRRYFGNTLFFMIGIPFGIGASLCAALLLSRDLSGKSAKGTQGKMFGVAVVLVGVAVALSLTAWFKGGGSWGMPALFVSVAAAILFLGVLGGQNVYRTLFYLPHFTSGVATYILWIKLFNTEQGPLTLGAQPILDGLSYAGQSLPPALSRGVAVLLIMIGGLFFLIGLNRMRRLFREGDLGAVATVLPFAVVCLPIVLTFFWYNVGEPVADGQRGELLQNLGGFLVIAGAIAALFTLGSFLWPQEVRARPMEGFGSAIVLAAAIMVCEFIFLGIGGAFAGLPDAVADGTTIEAPKWLSDPRWVKPSLMLVGFWGAVGSNTMLLYLAALTNVPGELYEAADIDGATPFQRFWNVTWPQLAPTTFFVVVMAVIGGLQGGFEMVRTMTQGGPGGASTTLAYDVYQKGFEIGRIGYASGVAWAMFAIIFVVTLFNLTFGNKYVND